MQKSLIALTTALTLLSSLSLAAPRAQTAPPLDSARPAMPSVPQAPLRADGSVDIDLALRLIEASAAHFAEEAAKGGTCDASLSLTRGAEALQGSAARQASVYYHAFFPAEQEAQLLWLDMAYLHLELKDVRTDLADVLSDPTASTPELLRVIQDLTDLYYQSGNIYWSHFMLGTCRRENVGLGLWLSIMMTDLMAIQLEGKAIAAGEACAGVGQ